MASCRQLTFAQTCADDIELSFERCRELCTRADEANDGIASAATGAFVVLAQHSSRAASTEESLDHLQDLLPRYLAALSPHATTDLAVIDAALYLLQADLTALGAAEQLDETIVLPLTEVRMACLGFADRHRCCRRSARRAPIRRSASSPSSCSPT